MAIDTRIPDLKAHASAFAEEIQGYSLAVWREALSSLRRNKDGKAPSIGLACEICDLIISKRQWEALRAAQSAAGAPRRMPREPLPKRPPEPEKTAADFAFKAIVGRFGRAEYEKWSAAERVDDPAALSATEFMSVIRQADELDGKCQISGERWCEIVQVATLDLEHAKTLLCPDPKNIDVRASKTQRQLAEKAIAERYAAILGRPIEAAPAAPADRDLAAAIRRVCQETAHTASDIGRSNEEPELQASGTTG